MNLSRSKLEFFGARDRLECWTAYLRYTPHLTGSGLLPIRIGEFKLNYTKGKARDG